MRRLYFRLIVPDGPVRRFRLPEDFGEERKPEPSSSLSRAAGLALAWCGLSAGCWLLAQGRLVPELSLEPLVAFSNDAKPQAWAMIATPPAANAMLPPSAYRGPALPNADDVAAQRLLPAGPQAVHTQAPALRTDLPKVSYTLGALHQGGEWGGPDEPRFAPKASVAPNDSALDGSTLQDAAIAWREPKPAMDPTAPSSGKNAEPQQAIVNQPRSSAAPTRSYDPFEADFVAVQPKFSLPVRDVVSSVAKSPQRSQREQVTSDQQLRGGSHVFHSGGGCQSAFDASNQVVNVAKNNVGTDATSEDYTAVLGRMNVSQCHPSRPLSIQVCVAVSDRRAMGTTVTTTPANAAVGSCIARQIAGMRFPASTGADLVRSRVEVE